MGYLANRGDHDGSGVKTKETPGREKGFEGGNSGRESSGFPFHFLDFRFRRPNVGRIELINGRDFTT